MKLRLIFLSILFLFHFNSDAQQYRFVYIQTENKQPFYVRISDAVYSSSSTGYVIIPKLKDGTYQFVIGFPKNDWPQQTFAININRKDAGFLLKNLGDKGWGLFNLQTMELLNAKNTANKKPDTGDIDDDPFTQVLSDVVNSPDLRKKSPAEVSKPVVKKEDPVIVKQEPVVKKEEPVIVKQEPAVKKEDPVITKEEPVVKKEEPIVKKSEPVATAQVIAPVKLFDIKDAEGRVLVYLDGSDTVRLFIPARQSTVKTGAAKVAEKPAAKEKFIDLELENPNSKKETAVTAPVVEVKEVPKDISKATNEKAPVLMINSDCTANAGDEDFMKLRKKMAASDNDEDMIKAAKKAFKAKCYNTAQIKNLSVLFLNDAGRYQFFDTAYPFVYDTANFSTLEQQLTDPYFITRFQAMIRR